MKNSETLTYQRSPLARLLTVWTAALALSLPAALLLPAYGDEITPPAVPDNLQVPAGNTVFLEGHAVGTQGYLCLTTATGVGWTFIKPQATLFADDGEQIFTHFLSANPLESGLPRATWQHSRDSSRVWAKMVASSSDANFVAAGAIPWFLLQTVGSQSGPTSGDTLTATTFVQRLTTSGGVAPSTGCAEAADVGNKALVPYSADYFFFKAD